MPTTPPPITPAPPAPIRHEKATFSDRVDDFVTWLVAVVAQFAALALNVFNNAKEAFDSAVAAANWAGLASGSAADSATSATNAYQSVIAAAAAANASPWASGTTYQQFTCAVSKVNFKVYRKTTSSATNSGGATDPANDPANWQATGLTSMPGGKRTSNTMLRVNDLGSYIELSGTFTQTFDSPALLGDGWCVWLRNTGTGDITIPSSDGRTNWIMYPGEGRLFQCDGTAIRSMVIRNFYKKFTSTQNFIKPPGYSRFDGRLWGAGASGSISTQQAYMGVGGSGGAAAQPFSMPAAVLADTELVTIAASVPGISASGESTVSGTAGGQSSFAGYIALGGQPGTYSADGNGEGSGGVGGLNTFGLSEFAGGRGGLGRILGSTPGQSTLVGGAGSGGTVGTGGTAASGTSKVGGSAGASVGASSATLVTAGDGVAPGGAGGACRVTHPSGGVASGKSGAGARGEMEIWGAI